MNTLLLINILLFCELQLLLQQGIKFLKFSKSARSTVFLQFELLLFALQLPADLLDFQFYFPQFTFMLLRQLSVLFVSLLLEESESIDCNALVAQTVVLLCFKGLVHVLQLTNLDLVVSLILANLLFQKLSSFLNFSQIQVYFLPTCNRYISCCFYHELRASFRQNLTSSIELWPILRKPLSNQLNLI